MGLYEAGRRLCLLFEAGGVRYAVEATAVIEVAPPDPRNDRVRGVFDLHDLARLLGGPQEERPGMGVVLDVSPTLAVRVRQVFEVVDVASATVFHLPRGLPPALASMVRGALLVEGQVYLELTPDAIARKPAQGFFLPPRAVHLASEPPDRGLVFESQGRRFGIPLQLVSQVVACGPGFSAVPCGGGPIGGSPIAGLFPHGGSLWPIYSVGGLLGGRAEREEFLVLGDLAGEHVGVTAARVIGVFEGFSRGDGEGEFVPLRAGGEKALFVDLQRMFS